MIHFLRSLRPVGAALLFALTLTAVAAAETGRPVKYVFLFIGDGMSLPQRMMTEEFRRVTHGEGLIMTTFPVQVTNTTHAANSFITDSAASGTAIACGSKTNSGVLGLDADGNRLESVAAVAKKNGRKVGILTSVSLDHATPAAFYAHDPSRGHYYAIAQSLLDSGFDFFGGGAFVDPDGKKAKRPQGNIFDLAQAKGFRILRDRSALEALDARTPSPVLAIAPRLADGNSMPYAIDAGPEDPSLADFTRKAIDFLDNDRGFFLMVEGGKIDWLCHANDAGGALREVVAFDDAIREAVKFAEKHPQDTLIVVTGDHETGALTLGFAGTGYKSYLDRLAGQQSSYLAFTDAFRARRTADPKLTLREVMPEITRTFGLKFTGSADDPMLLDDVERSKIEAAFRRSMGDRTYAPTEQKSVLYAGYEPLTVALTHVLNNKAGVGWNSFAHTALPVGTSVRGAGAERFYQLRDNTGIAHILKPLLGKVE